MKKAYVFFALLGAQLCAMTDHPVTFSNRSRQQLVIDSMDRKGGVQRFKVEAGKQIELPSKQHMANVTISKTTKNPKLQVVLYETPPVGCEFPLAPLAFVADSMVVPMSMLKPDRIIVEPTGGNK